MRPGRCGMPHACAYAQILRAVSPLLPSLALLAPAAGRALTCAHTTNPPCRERMQAVLYPIVTLAPARRARATAGLTSSGAVAIGVRKYVEHLEDVMIGAAARRGIAARGRVPGHTGVWAGDGDPNERVQADAGTGTDAFDGPRKLGAVGVQVRERVTTHGLALNVDLDVDMYTRLIVPCGMPGASATSLALEMARAGRPTAADELCVRRVLQEMSSDLCERLGFEPEERPTEELDVLLAEFAGDLEDNARV